MRLWKTFLAKPMGVMEGNGITSKPKAHGRSGKNFYINVIGIVAAGKIVNLRAFTKHGVGLKSVY